MMNIQEIVLESIRCAVCASALSEEVKTAFSQKGVAEEVYKLAKSHDMAHLVADTLEKNELNEKNTDIGACYFKQHRISVYRYEQIRYEFERICALFEAEKIPYIPLKGSVIRSLYPEPWMRTSCDIDVFVKKEDLDRAIRAMESQLSYVNEGDISHDVSIMSGSGVHIELHYDLIEPRYFPEVAQLLADIWDKVETVNGGCRYLMNDETFYLYHVAHMAKHFFHGGCGIRTFLDLWLLDTKTEYDAEKRDALLQRAKLLTFANAARKLAAYWFGGGETDEICAEMQDYVFNGGVYGNLENRIAVDRDKSKGRFGYIMSMIFLPYNDLKIAYPILKKHKWLYPFYQVRRWFRILFRGGISEESKRKLKVNAAMSKEKESQVSALLKKLDLENNTDY